MQQNHYPSGKSENAVPKRRQHQAIPSPSRRESTRPALRYSGEKRRSPRYPPRVPQRAAPHPPPRFTPENKSPATPPPTPTTSPGPRVGRAIDTSTQTRAPSLAHLSELTFPSQTPKVSSQVPGGQPGGFQPRPYTVSPVTHPHHPGTAARPHPPKEDALEGAVRASGQGAARRRNPGGV